MGGGEGGWTGVRTDRHTEGQTDEPIEITPCSIGHRLLRVRCPNAGRPGTGSGSQKAVGPGIKSKKACWYGSGSQGGIDGSPNIGRRGCAALD